MKVSRCASPQAARAWCFLGMEGKELVRMHSSGAPGDFTDVKIRMTTGSVARFSVGRIRQLQEAVMIVIAGYTEAVCGATKLYN